MKTWKLLSTLGAATVLAGGASAAVLQTHAGGTVPPEVTIIDTTNDTADWINDFGDSDDAGTLFYGVDFTVNNNNGETGSGGLWGGLQLFSGFTERLAVGNNWLSTNISTFGFGGDQDNGTPYVVGQTYRLVVQIDFVNGADDTATVWIDPVNAGSASTSLGSADASFDNIRIRGGDTPGEITLSNVVFATTFAEAVPEPGSLALLGLGGLALLRRRRSA